MKRLVSLLVLILAIGLFATVPAPEQDVAQAQSSVPECTIRRIKVEDRQDPDVNPCWYAHKSTVYLNYYDAQTGDYIDTYNSHDDGNFCWGCGDDYTHTVTRNGYKTCEVVVPSNSSANGSLTTVDVELEPLPTPTPTPPPTRTPPPDVKCDPDPYVVIQPPTLDSWEYEPDYPVVTGQDPDSRGFDLILDASGGWTELRQRELRQVCDNGNGYYPDDCPNGSWEWVCEEKTLEHYDDPIVSIDVRMRLDDSSMEWIRTYLDSRYYGAELKEDLPLFTRVFEDSNGAMSIRDLYAFDEYNAQDPGIHGGKIVITTKGTPLNEDNPQILEQLFGIPVYLVDTTLDDPGTAGQGGGGVPPTPTRAPAVTVVPTEPPPPTNTPAPTSTPAPLPTIEVTKGPGPGPAPRK